MDNLNHIKAQVADFAPEFTAIATRAERGRVDTQYGRKIMDGELRGEYEAAEIIMNGLLEALFKDV